MLTAKKRELANPTNREQKKWYLQLSSVGNVKSKEVARQMADETTMNPKEAEIAIFQLVKVMKRLLLSGYTVTLDDLGTFHLTATSVGAESAAALSAKNLKDLNIRFRPNVELKAAIAKAEMRVEA